MLKYLLALPVALLVLAACGVPRDEYEQVISERHSLLEYQRQLEEEHSALVNLYGALEERQAGLEATTTRLGEENQALALENESLREELSRLRPLVDDEALRLEIEGLRQERDQLLSAIDRIRAAAADLAGTRPAYWAGFACTGSMEPFFECGDVGIFLADPQVGDIHVGDVIDFPKYTTERGPEEPVCTFPSLPYDGTYIAHRVIARKVEGGTVYYQAKGDANVNADPCWIPHAYVNSKLVRVIEDVSPEDVIDTPEYDAALETYRLLERRYNELELAYEQELAYYLQVEDAYRSGSATYRSYRTAWESLERARLELKETARLRDQASDELERIEAETFGE